MSLEPKHILDALAHKLLRNRQEQPPADLFDRVVGELDQGKDRALFYWLNGLLGWVLAGAALSALVFFIFLKPGEPANSSADSELVMAEKKRDAVASEAENRAYVPLQNESSALLEHPSLAFAKTSPTGNTSVSAAQKTLQNVGYAVGVEQAVEARSKVYESTSRGEQSVGDKTSTTRANTAKSSNTANGSSVAIPEEFGGLVEMGFTERSSSEKPVEIAGRALTESFTSTSKTAANSSFLATPVLADVQTLSANTNMLGLKSCPSLAVGRDKHLRMNFYGGPRFDRQVFANVANDLEDYRRQREESETTNTGLNIGTRIETGATTGPFGGIGIEFGQYTSNGFTFGPVERWLALTYTENGVIDTVKLIPLRDTFAVRNRTQTMAFSLTGGYRYQMKRMALYVAADLNYEVVTESSGLVVDINGEDTSYRLGDDWVRKSPGVAIGGRAGIDINLLPAPNGDPGPLGLLLEATARNSGVFSGARDPLSYRYSRMGFNAGLRYTF